MTDISINIDIDSNNFEDTYKYPEWFNKKKYIFYNKTLARIQEMSDLHTLSSQYFDKMHYYIIGPSVAITALSGIASFLSTSQFVTADAQNAFGISVGIVASLSTVLQSISGACQFSAKKEAHRTVAEEYNKLIVALKFEIEMPNEEDFTDNMEKQIIDIQNKCNYFIPQFIIDNYRKKKKLLKKKIASSISGITEDKNKNVYINIKDENKSTEGFDTQYENEDDPLLSKNKDEDSENNLKDNAENQTKIETII